MPRFRIVVALLVALFSLACRQSPAPAADARESDFPRRYHIRAQEMPPPFHTPSAVNPPRAVERPAGAELRKPAGFRVEVYAEGGLERPRFMAQARNGDVFVAESGGGRVTILRDTNGDGRADGRHVFASGLHLPFGLAFRQDYLYVGTAGAVVRFRYQDGQTKAESAPEKITDLPGTGYREHWTRNVLFSPDGKKMYVTVGSETNVDVEADPRRAAISEYNPDGSGHRILASGLRNPVGLAWQPGTGKLWTAVNERDGLGDDLVPDYITSVEDGGFYGWPFSYIGQNEDPRRKGERPDLVKKALVPDVLLQSHTAALGIVFYEGEMFPAEYRGHAFVALRGSWNRAERVGYMVIRVPFADGKPLGWYEEFVSGWAPDPTVRQVWGRPVGLLVLQDGSLLISDDGGHRIWRVTYEK
jgi:glucose/arabinose dehydrogenase